MIKKEDIEEESRNVADYLQKYWTIYVDPNFDRTFSLRNWTTITSTIINHYKQPISKTFNGKKVFHIGAGPGYFLKLIKHLKGKPFGIEPYCSFEENLNIEKETLQDYYKKKEKEKFDIIVAHDFFVPTILHDKKKAQEIFISLYDQLLPKGIIISEHQNEETIIDINKFKKEKVNYENIENPYGIKCSQILLRKR